MEESERRQERDSQALRGNAGYVDTKSGSLVSLVEGWDGLS